jgi:hypothetical protein
MTHTHPLKAVLMVFVTAALSACGTTAGVDSPSGGTTAGSGTDVTTAACPQEDPGCIDTPQHLDDEPVAIDETGIDQLRRDAQFYLGASQDELPDVVRIGRIGSERMMLTEDYRIGRLTVELDDLEGDGVPVVTSVTVELPDGPETFELD